MKNVARPIVTLIKDGGKNSYITDVPEITKELNNRYKNSQGNSNYGVPFYIYNALAKKGEIKMKSMNLFSDAEAKSSEALFGDSKSKENTNQLPSAPIQDENGNLTFSIEGRTYSLNVNYKEERERVKEEININSIAKYDWFKEETGENHWVLYNTKMYEVEKIYLHYKEDSNLVPIIPINATSCYDMFCGCKSLTRLDLSNFTTSNVISMESMFYNCKALTQLDLSNFNTRSVTDMGSMFWGCESLTQLDLSSFNTSQVIDIGRMFSGCSNLTQLDLSSFNTSQITNMCGMFSACTALTQLNLSNFNTNNVTAMDGMFNCCYKLTQLDLSSFDTSKVVYMYNMFSYCKSLTQLDLSNFDTSEVYRMDDMFYNCQKLNIIYISDKWNVNSINYSDDMFNGCRSLPNFNEEKTNIEMAKPVEQGGYLTVKR